LEHSPSMIAVVIPTLGRPHKVAEIVKNLEATAPTATAYFVIEEHDTATADAIDQTNAVKIVNKRSPSYAGAVNTALAETSEPYLFVSADDFYYHDGWLEPLLEQAKQFGMVASNDLHNKDVQAGNLATCYLITRDYALTACIDEPGVMLHEGYTHNFVDLEVTQTAISRGQFVYCPESKVEHMHYLWGLAEKDETYAKSLTHHAQDQGLFEARRTLWRTQ
jgi:glycosyltransferase involved in cell wall biosynthesis